MYSDAHTHITGSPFGENVLTQQEIQALMKKVKEKGVVLVVGGGNNLASSRRMVELVDTEDILYASIGIHPWIAEVLDNDTSKAMQEMARHPKVVAIGEIGLDEARSKASKEVQMQCLRQQCQLAREAGLPPIIHQRGLYQELMEILKEEKPPAGIMHGFSGGVDQLKAWLTLGYHITVGRSVLTPEGQGLKEMVQQIPDDRLLLETDGSNRTKEGTVEGQERVLQVAQAVGAWRGKEAREIGELSTRNLKRVLKIT